MITVLVSKGAALNRDTYDLYICATYACEVINRDACCEGASPLDVWHLRRGGARRRASHRRVRSARRVNKRRMNRRRANGGAVVLKIYIPATLGALPGG